MALVNCFSVSYFLTGVVSPKDSGTQVGINDHISKHST